MGQRRSPAGPDRRQISSCQLRPDELLVRSVQRCTIAACADVGKPAMAASPKHKASHKHQGAVGDKYARDERRRAVRFAHPDKHAKRYTGHEECAAHDGHDVEQCAQPLPAVHRGELTYRTIAPSNTTRRSRDFRDFCHAGIDAARDLLGSRRRRRETRNSLSGPRGHPSTQLGRIAFPPHRPSRQTSQRRKLGP